MSRLDTILKIRQYQLINGNDQEDYDEDELADDFEQSKEDEAMEDD